MKNLYCGLITEEQILDLQEIFLTNGIHYITTPSFHNGRKLVYEFLEALRCYQSPACFTANGNTLKKSTLDLRVCLSKKNWDSFFVEEFNNDFLWIEYDEMIYHDSISLEKKIRELRFDCQLPILIFLPLDKTINLA